MKNMSQINKQTNIQSITQSNKATDSTRRAFHLPILLTSRQVSNANHALIASLKTFRLKRLQQIRNCRDNSEAMMLGYT
jgi:hypothetical protein